MICLGYEGTRYIAQEFNHAIIIHSWEYEKRNEY